jgi:hypothetical protein
MKEAVATQNPAQNKKKFGVRKGISAANHGDCTAIVALHVANPRAGILTVISTVALKLAGGGGI